MTSHHLILFSVLRKAFDGFDHEKKGAISTDLVGTILRMMGQAYNARTLRELIDEVDADGRFLADEISGRRPQARHQGFRNRGRIGTEV